MVRTKLVSGAEYDRMLKAQRMGCAICGDFQLSKDLAVDHDHATGRVRGLLCMRCNAGLGMFRDSCELLERAQDYLDGLTDTLTVTAPPTEWEEVMASSPL